MTTPQGIIRARRHDATVTFQVEGWGTMHHSLAVRRHAEQAFDAGAESIRVELECCLYLDSTFLGTLLSLKRALALRGRGSFALVCPSPQCQQLLHQMKLDTVFPIEPAAEKPSPLEEQGWQELAMDSADVDDFRHNVVQVHQELASLPGAAGEPFRAMVRGFESEMEVKK